jgi:hypothetical protein
MTRAEEDALLSDLAEADRHVRDARLSVAVVVGDLPGTFSNNPAPERWYRPGMNLAYVARLLRHALQIVEGEK